MPSEQALMLRELLRALPQEGTQDITEQRKSAEVLWPSFTADVPEATCEPVVAADVPSQWVRIQGADDTKVVLYLHGGGYTTGSSNTHRKLAAHIARSAGSDSLLIDYRLAPENPFPAGLDDAVAAYEWLLARGIAPADIAIAGDSAGGGLTVATAVRLREGERPLPGALVLLSPWTDLAFTGDSVVTKRDIDPLIHLDESSFDVSWYVAASGVDAKHPLVSPLYADLDALPRTLIQVGSDEVLLDDSVRLAERADQAGVDVALEVWPDMVHVFQMGAGNLPEATSAVGRIGAWLRGEPLPAL